MARKSTKVPKASATEIRQGDLLCLSQIDDMHQQALDVGALCAVASSAASEAQDTEIPRVLEIAFKEAADLAESLVHLEKELRARFAASEVSHG